MILASNNHEDKRRKNMHNCDEQHLEYWCIAHVQETTARCAKIAGEQQRDDIRPSTVSLSLPSLSHSLFLLSFSFLFNRSFPLSHGTFSIKAYYCTLLKRTIVHSVYHRHMRRSNDDIPSSTCFVVHASCTEELERFVHRILSFTIRTRDAPRRRTIDYRLVWGSLRLAPIT